MKKRLLLGATEQNEIVFANVEITTRNGYKEFTASFDSVRPQNLDDINVVELADDYLECLDDCDKYELCEQFNCTSADLAEVFADNSEIGDLMDCSLYPEVVESNEGIEYIFESGCCGQYDSRKDVESYITQNGYNRLMAYWDKYHLKEIDEQTEKEIIILLDAMDIGEDNEQDWICQYIFNNDL